MPLKANAAKGSNTQKIGDFYFSGLDTVNIEKQGLTPLKDELARVDKITDVKSLVAEFAHLETIGVQTPFGAM
jgi:putative endopeptidase